MTPVTRFDRQELKFIVSAEQRRRLTRSLLRRLQPDPHGDGSGGYPVVSVYYDNDGRDVYWEHVQGLGSRRKLRVRVYGGAATAAEPACFVEIKHSLDGRTVKRRAPLPIDQAQAVVHGGSSPSALPALEQRVVDEAQDMVAAKALRPVCVIRYDRQAFLGSGDEADLRVTFDNTLRYRLHDLVARPDDPSFDHVLLNGRAAILEVKVAEAIPYWLSTLLAQQHCLLQSQSKYCRIVEAGSNGHGPSGGATQTVPGLRWTRRPSGSVEATWTR